MGAVAVAADGAVSLGRRLAIAAAGKVHRHLQRVFEAQGLDGERATLFFGATAQLSLHTERHLQGAIRSCTCDGLHMLCCSALLELSFRTVSPILRPWQDLSPFSTSPFTHVALKERLSSSGTPSSSSWTLERIFCQHMKVAQKTQALDFAFNSSLKKQKNDKKTNLQHKPPQSAG